MQSKLLRNYQLSGIYGITDSVLMPGDKQLLEKAECALRGGLKLLQYRNKNPVSPEDPLRQIKQLVALCNDYHVPLIVNDDVMLAYAGGAHGVHLGEEDMSPLQARAILGRDAIIGVTCKNSVNRAQAAEWQGASYVAFGRFFPSKTKPEATSAPLTIIRKAKKHCALPVVAIGGITPDNCQHLIKAGADMIAVVHSLFAADDITLQMKMFNDAVADTKAL